MNIVRITKYGAVPIPRYLQKTFKPSDKVAFVVEGNIVILKKLTVPQPWEIAERKPDKGPPLKEIAKEIHAYRQEKRRKA